MLIAVEGCIGVGKTTVARGIAAYRKGTLLLETFDKNPFLPAFYENPEAHAIETEFTFLLQHYHQLKNNAGIASAHEVIADFHLGKDLLYAEANFKDSRTKQVFRHLYDLLSESVFSPTLMICLSATPELIIERIRMRKRDFELKIDPGYYAEINAAYEIFFAKLKCRKIKISMENWDFITSPDLFTELSALIDETLQTQ